MPREVKQGRCGVLGKALAHASSSAKPPSPRWFGALDPAAEAPPGVARPSVLPALLLLFAAVLLAVVVRAPLLRALLPMVPVIAALIVLWRARAAQPSDALAPSPNVRGIERRGDHLCFTTAPAAARSCAPPNPLLDVRAPFGVTLLTSPRRDRLIALLSSSTGTYTFGADFDATTRRSFAPLFERAFTVVGDETGLAAVGPDGAPLLFSPEELASLLDMLVEESPSCLDRFVLTDARGAALMLDGRRLCIGERVVDLTAPLEWRPIVFQEAFANTVAVYQGTWIKQGGTELWLVSLLPSLGISSTTDLDMPTMDRAILRDLRLMQATPEVAPPSEQRVAIERLFMLPVRSALDRAPRAARRSSRAQA